jgi:hypothetical protein
VILNHIHGLDARNMRMPGAYPAARCGDENFA